MEQIAADVYLLDGSPRHAINVYLVGDVLVDAGARMDKKRILRQLRGHTVTAHALTHVHPDHQGASHAVCEALGIPLWCPEAGVAAMERGDVADQSPDTWIATLSRRLFAGPGHPVSRALRDGDEVAGFRVIDTPGHAPSHIAFWRESDRLLIMGDVLTHANELGRVRLSEPRPSYTVDPVLNRESARKLARLNPEIICFGHGPVLRNGRQFQEFIAQLP